MFDKKSLISQKYKKILPQNTPIRSVSIMFDFNLDLVTADPSAHAERALYKQSLIDRIRSQPKTHGLQNLSSHLFKI